MARNRVHHNRTHFGTTYCGLGPETKDSHSGESVLCPSCQLHQRGVQREFLAKHAVFRAHFNDEERDALEKFGETLGAIGRLAAAHHLIEAAGASARLRDMLAMFASNSQAGAGRKLVIDDLNADLAEIELLVFLVQNFLSVHNSSTWLYFLPNAPTPAEIWSMMLWLTWEVDG